jgi:hypothetical protein
MLYRILLAVLIFGQMECYYSRNLCKHTVLRMSQKLSQPKRVNFGVRPNFCLLNLLIHTTIDSKNYYKNYLMVRILFHPRVPTDISCLPWAQSLKPSKIIFALVISLLFGIQPIGQQFLSSVGTIIIQSNRKASLVVIQRILRMQPSIERHTRRK